MICRIWHGWTSPADADSYERLLRSEIFHGIADRDIQGIKESSCSGDRVAPATVKRLVRTAIELDARLGDPTLAARR